MYTIFKGGGQGVQKSFLGIDPEREGKWALGLWVVFHKLIGLGVSGPHFAHPCFGRMGFG